jgi:hypothetical protein
MAERDELHAAIEARKELGPDYEPQVVDSFLERIEKRLEERKDSHLQIHPHPSVTPLALGSIGAGVGATAIAVGNGQGWVAVIAWIAIAIVNLGYALRRR